MKSTKININYAFAVLALREERKKFVRMKNAEKKTKSVGQNNSDVGLFYVNLVLSEFFYAENIYLIFRIEYVLFT